MIFSGMSGIVVIMGTVVGVWPNICTCPIAPPSPRDWTRLIEGKAKWCMRYPMAIWNVYVLCILYAI